MYWTPEFGCIPHGYEDNPEPKDSVPPSGLYLKFWKQPVAFGPVQINPPTIEVDLLYCIEGNEVSFDKELMISDFITEMNGVIEDFCKQNNLIEQYPCKTTST